MGASEIVVCRPHSALAPFVERYVGYHVFEAPGQHRGLPGLRPEFIIKLDRPEAFVAGLRTSPVLLPHAGVHFGIAVDLTPRGMRALFTTPALALTDGAVELSALAGKEAADLSARLAEQPGWTHRFEVLNGTLLAWAQAGKRGRKVDSAIIGVVDQLFQGGVDLPTVARLAKTAGWSRRHFSEVFRREVGLSPRQFVRVIRFNHSRDLLRAGSGTMASVAIAAGYYDQPHMLHEWASLAGCSPRDWLQQEFLSVQAEANRCVLPEEDG